MFDQDFVAARANRKCEYSCLLLYTIVESEATPDNSIIEINFVAPLEQIAMLEAIDQVLLNNFVIFYTHY